MEELLAQLLQQRALQTKAESDAKHGALVQQLRNPPGSNAVMRVHPQDRMPVLQSNDALNREMQANDIAALRERGLPIPEYMYNGLTAPDVAYAHKLGSVMQGYGGEPMLQPMMPGFKDPQQHDLLLREVPPFIAGTENSFDTEERALEKRMKVGELVDKEVQAAGGHFDPALLDGLTEQDAARRIADQLMARRAAMGDQSAWWATQTANF